MPSVNDHQLTKSFFIFCRIKHYYKCILQQEPRENQLGDFPYNLPPVASPKD